MGNNVQLRNWILFLFCMCHVISRLIALKKEVLP